MGPPDMRAATGARCAMMAAGDRVVARRLCREPFLMMTATVRPSPLAHVRTVARRLGDRPGISLVWPWWTVEAPGMLRAVAADWHAVAAESPAHRVMILANTAREAGLLREAGVAAVHCNQNATVDERVFTVDPQAARSVDAIYNARLHRFKRHALARRIPSLALIYYRLEEAEAGYEAEVRAALPHAIFVNELEARRGYGVVSPARRGAFSSALFAERHYVVLRPDAVAAWCNRARVGLCLSEREGAMYASMEYMLCGLPVVSTPNLGGRDHFFDPDYCITVPPDADAVAAATATLIARKLPPGMVRARTLARVEAERAILRAVLAEVLARVGAGSAFDGISRTLFAGPLWRITTVGALLGAD